MTPYSTRAPTGVPPGRATRAGDAWRRPGCGRWRGRRGAAATCCRPAGPGAARVPFAGGCSSGSRVTGARRTRSGSTRSWLLCPVLIPSASAAARLDHAIAVVITEAAAVTGAERVALARVTKGCGAPAVTWLIRVPAAPEGRRPRREAGGVREGVVWGVVAGHATRLLYVLHRVSEPRPLCAWGEH